ncbi:MULTISPECIES: alpha/beta hydrolase family protein [Methylobacterium]|uniref:alpha/beta hydrolase family protein n=1 Tax=Methylobacterium TaxID=407 RepID=UPI0013EAB6EC|nr:hypothetical protein [Methylobacterium sp. DB0501]NGM34456.1 hypothetical protein [Methylobacterium sp. DB0501]
MSAAISGCMPAFRTYASYTVGSFSRSPTAARVVVPGLAGDAAVFARWVVARDAAASRRAVIGVSEGGASAPSVAAQVPGLTHLVVGGAGAIPGRDSLPLITEARGWDGYEVDIARILDAPDDAAQLWRGHAFRYWASWLRSDAGPALASLTMPILMAHGTADGSMPVAAATRGRDLLLARNPRADLTLDLIEGADHALRTPDAAGRGRFLPRLDGWPRGRSDPA